MQSNQPSLQHLNFLEHTPVQKVEADLYVKREDLFAQPPLPPLAKLRGARRLLEKLKTQGIERIGVVDTRVSKAGWGIAIIGEALEMKVDVFYPRLTSVGCFSKSSTPNNQQQAFLHGAFLHPIQATRTNIIYATAKKCCEKYGIHLLPMGLTCAETVDEVAKELLYTWQEQVQNIVPKTVLCCTGTGTIFAGLAKGLGDLYIPPILIGVSCGMSTQKQFKRIKELLKDFVIPASFRLVDADFDYYTPCYASTPFPSSPYYDKKAWVWMKRYWSGLEKPVLFWNIGA